MKRLYAFFGLAILYSMLVVALPVAALESHPVLYPNNIECNRFEKIDARTWSVRNGAVLDLGNWDGAFTVRGRIKRGTYIKGGTDLYEVLDHKCEIFAG